ncbi:MAG: hypothetical protein ACFFFG_08205 [Candidatus Thorarchaeota archaeon]
MTTPQSTSQVNSTSLLKFEPTVTEQMLLPQLQAHNLLILYNRPTSLIRILALFSLFYYNQMEGRILILTKKSSQMELQVELKKRIKMRSSILNGAILPNARRTDYGQFPLIVSTPSTTKNDIMNHLVTVDHFGLILIDHAEMGSSSRTLRWICSQFHHIRRCGFTQMTERGRLKRVQQNMGLNEIISYELAPKGPTRPNLQHYPIPLPQEYHFILDILNEIRKYELKALQSLGLPVSPKSSHKEIALLHDTLKTDQAGAKLVKTGNLLRIITLQKTVVSKGFPASLDYFQRLEKQLSTDQDFLGKYGLNEFLTNPKIMKIRDFLFTYKELMHPKIQMLLKMVRENTGLILVITPNFDIASYIASIMQAHEIPLSYFSDPLSKFSEIQIKQRLAKISGFQTRVAIANTVNTVLAERAKIIIGFEVSAALMERFDRIEVEIPRVFLIAKQTTEEQRFFQLKNLGRPRTTQTSDVIEGEFQGKNKSDSS